MSSKTRPIRLFALPSAKIKISIVIRNSQKRGTQIVRQRFDITTFSLIHASVLPIEILVLSEHLMIALTLEHIDEHPDFETAQKDLLSREPRQGETASLSQPLNSAQPRNLDVWSLR